MLTNTQAETMTKRTAACKFWWLLLWSGLVANIVVFGITQICDSDVWGHALHGRIIVEQGRLPRFSDYSWFPDHEPRHFNCAIQVMLYLVLQAFGYYGLLALVTGVLAAICLFLFKALALHRVPLPLVCVGYLLFLVLGHCRFLPKGDFFNLLLWIVYIFMLEKCRQQPTAGVWLLAGWQLLWTNLHQLAIGGPALILLYAMTCWLEGKKEQGRMLTKLALLCFAVCFINFSGYRQVFASFEISFTLDAEDKKFFTVIGEFLPLMDVTMPVSQVFYCLCVFVITLLFIANRRHGIWHHLPIFIGLSLITWRHSRFIGFFAIHTAFLLPMLLWLLAQRCQFLHLARTRCLLRLAVVLLGILQLSFAATVATGTFFRWNAQEKKWGVSLSNVWLPVKTVELLQQWNFNGNIYNDYNTGSYLAYRLYPRCRTFVNCLGRTAYSTACYRLYNQITKVRIDPTATILAYHIELFVIDHKFKSNTLLLQWLYKAPDWLLIHLDEATAVFASRQSSLVQQQCVVGIDIDTVRQQPAIATSPDRLVHISSLLLDFGCAEEAGNAARQALSIDNKHALAWNCLGVAACMQKQWDAALQLFVTSLECGPPKVMLGGIRQNIDQLFRDEIVFDSRNPLHRKAMALCHPAKK